MSLSSCPGPILLPQWAFALQRAKPPPNQCAVHPVRPSACTQDLPSWRSDGIGGGRLIQIGSSANGVLVSRWFAIGREAPMGEADTVSTIRLASTGVVRACGDLGTVLERPRHGAGVPSCETPADQAIRERPADCADGGGTPPGGGAGLAAADRIHRHEREGPHDSQTEGRPSGRIMSVFQTWFGNSRRRRALQYIKEGPTYWALPGVGRSLPPLLA